MCGFAGFYDQSFRSSGNRRVLENMGDTLGQRGPDGTGIWFDEELGLGIIHKRLMIIELSDNGSQPMVSDNGRYTFAFNGEVYNHQAIREELESANANIIWRGASDTETLFYALQYWGVEKAIGKSEGMFAFVLWDSLEKKIVLGRDRFGEKPLYYGWQNNVFMFASQLAGLRSHPAFEGQINRDALALLMRHNYIPAPYSIYKSIFKLEPGQLYTLNVVTKESNVNAYWSSKTIAERLEKQRFDGCEKQAIGNLESLLKGVVKDQMLADVPVGAFLSGGIDSSLVAALMQDQTNQPIKTFSIGFDQDEYNEAGYAKKIAEHLGTDHTEWYVTEQQLLGIIQDIAVIYDEPFSDSSQIPTILVSQLASDHVTVVLSGDAADELFCGYNRYLYGDGIWRKLVILPRVLRRFLGKVVSYIPVSIWNYLNRLLPRKYRVHNLGDKMHKAAGLVASYNISGLYKGLVSHWISPEKVVLNSKEPETVLNESSHKPKLDNDIEQMMLLDMLSYLPGDILTKVDRASMAASIEVRVPFLNHQLVKFAWSLPLKYKLRSGITKWCLRKILYKHVPRELLERPKMGFGVPLDQWLRGPLKEWASGLLNEQRLVEEGFFEPGPIVKMWEEHLSHKRNWQYQLWDVLMFQVWYEKHHK